jgi:hypothetical protein
MASSLALTAGEGDAGFRDGDFAKALFKTPYGLAISEDGNQLFVADTGNNRIRVVHLDQNNKVATLTGQTAPGSSDGPLASALFNQPRRVACLPGDRLVVFDYGNNLLRLVDMKQGMVSTLAGHAPRSGEKNNPPGLAEGPADQVSVHGLDDMVYFPAADSLFYSQPDQSTLKRLDMKTRQVTVVFSQKPGLLNPGALCVAGGKLYVADHTLPQVYRVDWKTDKDSGLSLLSSSPNISYALAGNADSLYAFHYGIPNLLEQILPRNSPVTYVTPAGDIIGQNSIFPFYNFLHPDLPASFVADPLDNRKFYFANPSWHIVCSYRDITGPMGAGGDPVNSNGLSDFEYPLRKPPRTFRILLVGDSRSVMVVNYDFHPTWNTGILTQPSPRQISLAKRMELELNTLAALEDAPMNFEVLNMSHSAAVPLFLWPTYEVPAIVQKNDIDLVLIMQPPTPDAINSVFQLKTYFERPLTAEGIPTQNIDPEYLVKPPRQRIPPGDLQRFYNQCQALHAVTLKGNDILFDPSLWKAPELHDELVQMYGKPLDLLHKKLSTLKTSAGDPVRLLVVSTQTGYFHAGSAESKIWNDVTEKYQVPFLDLKEEIRALQPAYYLLDDNGTTGHMNPDGHLFFSQLLAHDLIRDHFVPWTNPAVLSTPGPSSR